MALVFAALLVGGFSSAVASARTWRGPQQLAGARPGTYRDSVVLSDGEQALAVAGHVHDYGTKFLVAAGLMNILAMVDAYEIAIGKKD